MSFDHPWWLLALALAPLSAWLRLRPSAPPQAARASATARALLVAALALALAGSQLWRRAPELTALFLLDHSLSLDPEVQERAFQWVREAARRSGPRDRSGILLFGADAVVESLPRQGPAPARLEGVVDRGGTDVAAALRLAQAILPPGSAGRVVLLSDGRETSGDLLAQGLQLAAAGIPVDAVPLAGAHAGDVMVERLAAPPEAAPREPFEMSAVLWASTRTVVTARLFREDRLIETRSVRVPAGPSALAFKDSLAEPGLHGYRLYLDSPDDPRPQNNQASAAVSVAGPPTVLLVEGAPGRGAGVASALAKAGMEVRAVGRGRIPRSLAELEPYAAVILSDVPAYAMTPRGQAELRAYVGDLGGGLAMFGGGESFGAGGWLHTPVEEALPVSMETKKPGADLSLAIVIVVDRSGSMAEAPYGVQKIELANEGAMRVVEMLGQRQSIGICAVDTDADWVVPLQPADDKGGIIRRIGGLRAGGGGIYVYTGLEAAQRVLDPVKAAVRHVILFADAADSEEQVKAGASALDLVSRMAAEGITVSVVGLGAPSDKDAAFLEEAARRGQGRYYLTEEIQSVPSIFMRETVLARRSAIVEEPFLPSPKAAVEPARGIDWLAAPELRGYVITEPKEAAEVGLVTHRGDPLLATWRFGLGKSLAFTSDASGRWSAAWGSWPGAGKLWAQSARWLLREPPSEGLTLRFEPRAGEPRVVAEAAGPDGAPLNFLQVEGTLVTPALERRPLRLAQTGPGRYEASLPGADAAGAYLVQLRALGGEAPLAKSGGFTVPYPPEFRHHGADAPALARLAEVTGGRWDPAPGEVFARVPGAGRRATPLSGWLLAFAALLLAVDVALRRLRFKAEAWEPVAAAAKSRWESVYGRLRSLKPGAKRAAAAAAPAPAAEEPAQDAWARLKEAKKRARKQP